MINVAMPHLVQKHIIEKRLKGKFGKARVKELNEIMAGLPGYKNGPYGDLRKQLNEEMTKTRARGKTLHNDEFAVRREGFAQFVLVGPPNIGKSSLLHAISGKQIKIADYAFTTIRPESSAITYSGIPIQLVEIPGLIKGASEDKGLGRRLIGAARNSDAIIYIHDLTQDPSELEIIMGELNKAGVEKPYFVVCNKNDLATESQRQIARERFSNAIFISAVTKEGFEELRKVIWDFTGLIRVYTDNGSDPVALKRGSTVLDLARKIHNDLAKRVKTARITGSSVKFPNQIVGIDHLLDDNDRVKLID